MKLRHIEVVNAIRASGTLKATAALLSFAQPAVMQILQSAKRQLGYALVERTRGKLAPTREAQRLFPEIMKLDEPLNALQRLADNLRGGTDESSIRLLAAPALAFGNLHPHVKLSVRSGYSANAVANIALAARSRLVTIVDELSALSARELGLNVVPLAPDSSIPVVTSFTISSERSALVDTFVQLCRKIVRAQLGPRAL